MRGQDLQPGEASGVLCSRLLEYLPDEDVPWILDEMFAKAQRFLFLVVDDQGEAAVAEPTRRPRRPPGRHTAPTPAPLASRASSAR